MRSMMVAPAVPSIPLRTEPLAMESKQPRTTKRISTAPAAAVWKVDETTILSLPSIYMLERTHTTVEASPATVATRISDCLRRESISACFNSREGLVEAETRENVKFVVRLWKKNSQQVIVESQKLDGCCFLYCQAAKAVLRAAKGQPAAPKRTFALPACVPRETDDAQKSCVQSGLEMASTMIKSDRLDSHVMAIDTLLHISKVTEKPAFAAHCILCGEFRSTLFSLIECFRMDRSQAESPLGEVEQQHVAIMHRNALTIIANCLEALQTSRELVQVIAEQEGLESSDFLAALIEDVAACQQRPHDACEATRCLRPLMNASGSIRRKVLELGAADAVEAAAQEGCCRHALLENACTKLRCEM